MSDQDQRPTVRARPVVTLPGPAERERAIAALSDAFARDLLEVDEFERRVTVAQTSNSRGEIDALAADLPSQEGVGAVTSKELVPAAQVSARGRFLAILGGVERRGSWTVPRRLKIVAVMGGASLDFREARLPAGVVELHVVALMGGVEIIVPPHLPVEASGNAIMGGFEQVDRTPQNPDLGAPLLRIVGLVVMGGVQIEMRLPGESGGDAQRRRRGERRALRAASRAR